MLDIRNQFPIGFFCDVILYSKNSHKGCDTLQPPNQWEPEVNGFCRIWRSVSKFKNTVQHIIFHGPIRPVITRTTRLGGISI